MKDNFVVCNVNYNNQFTKDKIYKVRHDIKEKDDTYMIAEDDIGSHSNGWGANNFQWLGNDITELHKAIWNIK